MGLWAHVICLTHALNRPIPDGHLVLDLVLCLGETDSRMVSNGTSCIHIKKNQVTGKEDSLSS